MSARTLDEALERLRLHRWHLWKVYQEAHGDPTLPERWREAPEGSQERRKACQYVEALRTLGVSMGV